MDIKTFFEKSEGKWFTQRTRYNLAQKSVDNAKAELTVELLGGEDSAIAALCQEVSSQINPPSNPNSLSLAGARITWENQAETETGESLIALIPDDQQQGQFVQKLMNSDQTPTVGDFVIAEDEALTLSSKTANNSLLKERLWFAHPNLRLRTMWEEHDTNQQSWVLFYSEIRRLNT
ncbi:MAG: phycobiliprotein lyase [Halothece sp.]